MTSNNMPTKLPTISLVLTRDLMKEINEYQRKHGILSKNEVVRQLLRKALKQENSNPTDRKR